MTISMDAETSAGHKQIIGSNERMQKMNLNSNEQGGLNDTVNRVKNTINTGKELAQILGVTLNSKKKKIKSEFHGF